MLEAKQALEDGAAAGLPHGADSEEPKLSSLGLEKTKAENELKLLQQRASDLKDLITREFTLVAGRIRASLHAEPAADQALSVSAEETIEDLSKHKSAAHAQLAALVDTVVQPGLTSVHPLTTKAELDGIVKETKDGGRDLRKNNVKQFLELLAKTKRYVPHEAGVQGKAGPGRSCTGRR